MDTARLVRWPIPVAVEIAIFVLAARALGADGRRIMVVHLIPNRCADSSSRVAERRPFHHCRVGISFLGVGVSPPTASWGSMLADFSRICAIQRRWCCLVERSSSP